MTQGPGPSAPTVLLVDDQPTILRTLMRFLELKGYNVEIAESVAQAVPLLDARTFAAVVLDIRMPGQSGLELLAQMRQHERWRELPAVILTGQPLTPPELTEIAKLKAYVFLKPKSYGALTEYLDRVTRAKPVPRTV